jgi:hypothetical protein
MLTEIRDETDRLRDELVTAVKGRAVDYWKSVSLPFPEPGVRLIRRDAIDAFNAQIGQFCEELDNAVAQLDHHFDELRSAARQRLSGTLMVWIRRSVAETVDKLRFDV